MNYLGQQACVIELERKTQEKARDFFVKDFGKMSMEKLRKFIEKIEMYHLKASREDQNSRSVELRQSINETFS
jgi:hypothetical protein